MQTQERNLQTKLEQDAHDLIYGLSTYTVIDVTSVHMWSRHGEDQVVDWLRTICGADHRTTRCKLSQTANLKMSKTCGWPRIMIFTAKFGGWPLFTNSSSSQNGSNSEFGRDNHPYAFVIWNLWHFRICREWQFFASGGLVQNVIHHQSLKLEIVT